MKNVYQRETYDDFFFFRIGHQPSHVQDQVLWTWAFGSGGLSSRVPWAALSSISGSEHFISDLLFDIL